MSASVLRFPDGRPILALSPIALGLIVGARVVHQRFGTGSIIEIDGNKLTVDFDAAGRKRVVDSFVRSTAGAR